MLLRLLTALFRGRLGHRRASPPCRAHSPYHFISRALEALEDRTVPSTLEYSTFLGGGGTDEAYAVAADAAGNTYVTGMTGSTNFPATAGAFDTSLGGLRDAFVAKLRPDGSLAWATYLGGSGDERGHGIAVDGGGNVYVMGRTDSADFPTTAGSLDTTFGGGVDAFITKLSADGQSLGYSTYLGGSGFEIDEGFDALARRVGSIALDSAGNAYVTGSTTSGDFPTTAGAFRTTSAGFTDVFVSKLNAAGSALIFSTYLGGSDHDRGRGIAVDAGGNVFVTGEVVSTDYPTTAGAFQIAKAGGFSDSFVTKLNAAGSAAIYSSYLGGTGSEFPGRLALDNSGQVYVTGATASFDFPTTTGAFQTAKAANGSDAFVTKVNAAGSALVYSTYLGGTFGDDFGEGIAVDSNGQAHVTGHTSSGTFPVANAFQPARSGLNDAFVTSLNAAGTALVDSTYLGGGNAIGTENGYGIAVDSGGTVHVVGKTNAAGDLAGRPPFPTTVDAIQGEFGGGASDAFVALLHGSIVPPPPPPPPPPPLPSLSINDFSRAEGQRGTKQFVFTVTLSAPSTQPVTLAFSTSDGTATLADGDYRGRSGTLSFAPGELSKTITVLVNGDRRVEANETFFVNLSSAAGASIGDSQGRGTIRNDDRLPARQGFGFRILASLLDLWRTDFLPPAFDDPGDWGSRRDPMNR